MVASVLELLNTLASSHEPCEKWHRNGTAMAQKNKFKFSRNDDRYWVKRVYRPKYKGQNENPAQGGFYHVKIQAHGERRGVSLQETEKKAAAEAAKKLDALVKIHGWEKGLLEFRGVPIASKSPVTLGEYLSAVAATGTIKPGTLEIYARKVRTIADFIQPVKMPQKPNDRIEGKTQKPRSKRVYSKYDHATGGAEIWRKLVDATPIEKLSPPNILRWRNEALKPFHNNPLKLMSTTRTVNSDVRAGQSIFAAKVRAKIPSLQLPDPIPFSTTDLLKEAKNPYRSKISSPDELLMDGANELAMTTAELEFQAMFNPKSIKGVTLNSATPHQKNRAETMAQRKHEAFKGLILGLCAGLRRGEIDRLLWEQVDFGQSCIWAETTDVFELKADSSGKIVLDSHIMDLIKYWKQRKLGRYVLEGSDKISQGRQTNYRVNQVHELLVQWLKSKGITNRMSMHTLRKEFGSIICGQAGIHAASKMLRHANISQTAEIYADHRKKITVGIGDSLGRMIKMRRGDQSSSTG